VRAAVGAGGLAGLVNNAGISVTGPLEYVPVSALRSQLEVNVVGPVAATQAFLPLLRAGHGRVVNIGSIAGRIATPLVGPYCASKFALEAITDALRMELLPWGLHVSIVEPGVVRTPIWERGLAMGEEVLRDAPPLMLARYGRLIAGLRSSAAAAAHGGVPPDAVARVVVQALTAPRPRTRYVVGADARLRLLFRRLPIPDRVRDRLILRLMGRSAKPLDAGRSG
jgi:NAD(P)-dependent dehydrogenase (short-subunit alcohol dehydrogenase family)